MLHEPSRQDIILHCSCRTIMHDRGILLSTRAFAMPCFLPTRRLRRRTNTRSRPYRQTTRRIPLVLHVIRRPRKFPFRKHSASLDLLLQALAISAQLPVRDFLTSDLKFVLDEPVVDIAAVLRRFQRQRFQFYFPPA